MRQKVIVIIILILSLNIAYPAFVMSETERIYWLQRAVEAARQMKQAAYEAGKRLPSKENYDSYLKALKRWQEAQRALAKAEAEQATAEAATQTAPPPAPKTGIFGKLFRGLLWSLPLGTVTGPEEELNLDLKREGLRKATDKGMGKIQQLIRERDKLARIDPTDPNIRRLNQQLREALSQQSRLLQEQRKLRSL